MPSTVHSEVSRAARTRWPWARAGLIGAVAVAAFAVVATSGSGPPAPGSISTASAQSQDRWPCDNTAYITADDPETTEGDSELHRVDPAAGGSFDLVQIGTYEDSDLNGLAFRKDDSYMYAWDNDADEVVRIERGEDGNAEFVPLGPPGFADGQNQHFNGGEILPNGNMLLSSSLANQAAVIDPTGPSVVRDLFQTNVVGTDVALNHADLRLYGRRDVLGQVVLYQLDENGLTVDEVVVAGDVPAGGAQWFDPLGGSGRLIIYAGNLQDPGPGLYAVDISEEEPVVERLGDAPGVINLDGAACHTLRAPQCAGIEPTLVATRFDDVLVGTDGPDVIVGSRIANEIHGGGGDDRICGRTGRNTLFGGHGDDRINGGPHANVLDGGPGRDRLVGGRGPDTLLGREGRDIINGGVADDVLFGNHGGDILRGFNGNDELGAGAGHDVLSGGRGIDTCRNGPGNDTQRGCEG